MINKLSIIQDTPSTYDKLRILFLHHSTGRNLIQQGEIRKLINQFNSENSTKHEFWDHDYNKIGLSDPNGQKYDYSFNIPDDNTDPSGFEVLFTQPIIHPPENALSKILMFDVVIFKSCFPASAIRNQFQLDKYKEIYITIRKILASQKKTLFIPMTPPPLIPLPFPVLIPLWTNKEDALRARNFSNWLVSRDFHNNLPNVYVFDFFNALATSENQNNASNILKSEYRSMLGLDSHPNKLANKSIAVLFVDFIFSAINDFSKKKE